MQRAGYPPPPAPPSPPPPRPLALHPPRLPRLRPSFQAPSGVAAHFAGPRDVADAAGTQFRMPLRLTHVLAVVPPPPALHRSRPPPPAPHPAARPPPPLPRP